MRIKYADWSPGPDARATIAAAEAICADYRGQGYDLTLRQLYYQFVARGLIANEQRAYKRLGDVVNKARLAGLLSWSYIVDRTRNLESLAHWSSPHSVVRAAADGFALDKWATQPVRVEVWVEKEALAGVVQVVAERLDVAYFSCRGYVSQSELWGAAQRLGGYIAKGQRVVVLHLGDHDPSGIDMTRDITDRLRNFSTQDYLNANPGEFVGQSVLVREILDAMAVRCARLGVAYDDDGGAGPVEVRRIALNMDQVERYDLPPNPAKLTDSRVADYLANYGDESWELDALDPRVLDSLIEDQVLAERDEEAWAHVASIEDDHRRLLSEAARRWTDVATFLET